MDIFGRYYKKYQANAYSSFQPYLNHISLLTNLY